MTRVAEEVLLFEGACVARICSTSTRIFYFHFPTTHESREKCPSEKASKRETFFVQKTTAKNVNRERVRESKRESKREKYDRHHRRTKKKTFELDAFFFFFFKQH